jgi:hypothetical protein
MSAGSVNEAAKNRTVWYSREWPAFAVCLLGGVLISTLPHLLAWLDRGDPVWFADHDDTVYVSKARAAMRGEHLRFLDSVDRAGRSSILAPAPLVPGVILARLLGWDTLRLNIAWRLWAGLTLALGWYLVVRLYTKGPWPAAALVFIALADAGYGVTLQPLVRQATILARLVLDRPGELFDNPLHRQWRILNPGLTLPYMMVFVWAVVRALRRPSVARTVMAGATFGLLFYVYFYFWTAAALAVALGWALDAGHRRVYLQIGCIGAVLGSPAVIGQFSRRRSISPDWLVRTDFFLHVPRFSEIEIPKILTLTLIVAGVWVWFRRRDLLFPFLVSVSSWALLNHHVVTGVLMQNRHFHYVATSMMLLIVLAALAELVSRLSQRSRLAGVTVAATVLAYFATGLWIRAVDARHGVTAAQLANNYARYKEQRIDSEAPPLVPGATVAGTPGFTEFALIKEPVSVCSGIPVYYSPYVSQAELDERIALDARLRGIEREAFAAAQRRDITRGMGLGWGPGARDRRVADEQLVERLRVFDAVEADPERYLDRYDVLYLAQPTGVRPGEIARDWTLIQRGPTWDIWQRALDDR